MDDGCSKWQLASGLLSRMYSGSEWQPSDGQFRRWQRRVATRTGLAQHEGQFRRWRRRVVTRGGFAQHYGQSRRWQRRVATRIGLAQHDGQFRRCYFDRCYFEALQKIGAAARRCEVRCHFDRFYLEALQLERINIYFNEDARGRYASLAISTSLERFAA